MPTRPDDFTELKSINYELFILAITLLSLINIPLWFFAPDPIMRQVVMMVEVVISILFLGDFTYRLVTARSKPGYLIRQRGWLDLLGSLPVPGARLLRIYRARRVYRCLREYKLQDLGDEMVNDQASTALVSIFFLVILVVEFGSYLIVGAEAGSPSANILTAGDALWWALVTVATIGYGDRFPVTTTGRLIGVLVILTGVGLFSVLTGYLANSFVARRKRRRLGEAATAKPVDDSTQLAEIRRLLEEQGRAIAALEARLKNNDQE